MDDSAGLRITPDMTVLDVIGRYRETEAVFKRWDDRAGICICCQALFDPLQTLARRCNLDPDRLIADLHAAVGPDAADGATHQEE